MTMVEIGYVLITSNGQKLYGAVQFGFRATNNMAKYKALTAFLRMTQAMKVTHIKVHSDSQLVVNQARSN